MEDFVPKSCIIGVGFRGFEPLGLGFFRSIQAKEDVSVMLQQGCIVGRAVLQGHLDRRQGLFVAPHLIQNPGVGILVGCIGGFFQGCPLTHGQGRIQILATQTEVIGKIVKHQGIVRLQAQGLTVTTIRFGMIGSAVFDIPQHDMELRFQFGLISDVGQSAAKGSGRFIFFAVSLKGNSKEEIISPLRWVQIQGSTRNCLQAVHELKIQKA